MPGWRSIVPTIKKEKLKPLILLLLIPLFACSHDHPLTEHQHDHTHDHDLPDQWFKYPDTLPFTYIVDINPPMTGASDLKIGLLTASIGTAQVVTIDFSRPPQGLTITDVPDPAGFAVTPLKSMGSTTHRDAVTNINQVRLYTDCSDPEHAGGIAVQLEWDTGSALLRYLCPEEEE